MMERLAGGLSTYATTITQRSTRVWSRPRAVWLPLALTALLIGGAPAAASADACTPPVTSPVACENLQPGADPLDWEVSNSGDSDIQGFATAMSVNRGSSISFKVKSTTPNFHVSVYRLGYYGGLGARLVAPNITPTGSGAQPDCEVFPSTGLVDCGNWSTSATWNVPSTAVSGVYVANLTMNSHVRGSDEGISQVVFVVRDDASTSDLLYQTSDQTWQAYNHYPNSLRNSLYGCTVCPGGNPLAYQAAFKVSYNRPLQTEVDSPGSSLFNGAEYPMIRFLEQNGFNVSYFSGVDTHARGSLIKNHKAFISSGHDEYWSREGRANVEAARDAGTSLAFFSGNEMFWKTRFEPAQAGPATDDRTLVSYKDTHFNAPTDPVEWTGTWRDRRYATSHQPENALIGQSFVVNAGSSRITVPYAYRLLRMWRNTAATSLAPGASLQLAPETLGYEWDVDPDNGFRPAGAFRLSSTTVSGVDAFTDYGSTVQSNSTVTHNMTMYRAPSGALVLGAGTVQWSWGLSDWRNRTPDRNMQQATVNVFADMGAQPATLEPNLVAAAKSTDTTAPTAAIIAPPASVADGAQVTIAGTASDAGGQVGGVEVSTDAGATWRPATGTTSWTYSWTAHGAPAANIRVRATDDSGNIGNPGAGVNVTVNCPCTIFAGGTPALVDAGDNTPTEVGVKFRSDAYGQVTGVRFYKSAANTGTHTGSLWSENGTRLAQATFTNETASGWQTVTFSSPVTVTPGTTYVASYYAPNGRYSATPDYFWQKPAPGPNGGSSADSPPLRALRTTPASANGVYAYGPLSSFPVNSFNSANYWVDVLFTRIAAPGSVSGVTASAAGLTSATVRWNAPTSGGPPASYTITPYIGTTAQTPTTISGAPPARTATITGLTTGTTYTFRVQAVNPAGSGPQSAGSNAVTPLTALAPSAPQNATAEAGSGSARVTWQAPVSDGDSPITGYRVTPYIGSTAQTPTQVGPSARSVTVTGLTNQTSHTFRVTATNAIGTSPAATTAAVTPRLTIFDFGTPATVDAGDPDPVEVGVKFRADHNGSVTGIRFYKAAANTGTHTGSLWAADGTRLAQATFTNETATGWQSVLFAAPVPVTAGTTYVASYFAPGGHYSHSGSGLASGADNGPLHAIPDGVSSNGVYAYGTSSSFPFRSFNASNYWVDVLYDFPKPGQPTSVTAAAGRKSATVTWAAPANGGPIESYTITPYLGAAAQPSTTITAPATTTTIENLTAGASYRFSVRARNASGPGSASALSNAVVPTGAVAPSAPTNVVAGPATSAVQVTWTDPVNDSGSPLTRHTITPYLDGAALDPVDVGASATSGVVTGLTNGRSYTFTVTRTNGIGTSPQSAPSGAVSPAATIFDFAVPATADSGDTSPIEVGVKFKADVDGRVTGVRFHKAAGNSGTHIGSLWTTGDVRLAQATFTNESASGWQSVLFATPVDVTAGTTYVASYFAPNGRYSYAGAGLAAGADNGVLHALPDSQSPNGVYSYGSVSSFPTNSYNAADYGVDVLFQPTPVPGPVTGVNAVAGGRSATLTWTAPSSGGAPTAYKVTPYIGSSAEPSSIVTGTPPAAGTTITGLANGTEYTFTVTPRNGGGPGPESAPSNAVTPSDTTTPSAPGDVRAQPATSAAQVSWSEPLDGGSPITGYTVTPYVGGSAQTPVPVSASTTRTTVTGLANGTDYTFKVSATNAAGTGAESAASQIVTPRATIFDFATPAIVDGGDAGSIAVGIKFQAEADGVVNGLRFYKATASAGPHIGSLYTSGGQLLGQATFADESPSGWQSVLFDTPVPVTAETTYVASYLAPNGHYSVTGAAFATGPVDNPPLRALSDLATPNGVYAYSGSPVFPTSNFNATNYWVDVLFTPGS